MTTQQRVPPSSATPYTPMWALYIYGTRAFFTYDARLIAVATVATPAQQSRIEAVFHRLAHHATQGSIRS